MVVLGWLSRFVIGISPLCVIKIFWRAGVVTPSNPLPPTNNICLYPPPFLRCFWKDPLMTPHHLTSSILHCYPPYYLATPSTTPFSLKILIIHPLYVNCNGTILGVFQHFDKIKSLDFYKM